MTDSVLTASEKRENLAACLMGLAPDAQSILDEVSPNWRASLIGKASGFTDRENDLLRLLCRGLPNKAIAKELRIAESTVKNNLRELFLKIGVHDRVNAVLWAHHHGIPLGPSHSRGQAATQPGENILPA